jgi:glycosyltransferase involved in cell wall biosynthesis
MNEAGTVAKALLRHRIGESLAPETKLSPATAEIGHDSSKTTAELVATPKKIDLLVRKGQICILSRKDLRNITRVSRMAKALFEAGYGVTVVSLGLPIEEQRAMCLGVDYRQVGVRPFLATLHTHVRRRNERRQKIRRRREEAYQRALAAGGWRGLCARLVQLLAAPFRTLGAFAWSILAATPAAFALKKADQTFAAARRDFAANNAWQIFSLFLGQMRQAAVTRGFSRAAEKALRDRRFDVVQAHDNYALVAATRLAARDKAKLIYDAVELTSHRMATNFSRFERLRERHQRQQEAAIFCKAAAITTVGDGLANWYAQHHPIVRPLVVRNCRYHWPYEVDGRLRADAGVGPEVPLVIWFGGAYPQQGIEILLNALPLMASNIHVAIVAWVLPRWVSYVSVELPQRAAVLGVADRVHILPPRDPNDLVPYVSGANLGVIPRPSEHLNNFFSMPNKFLEMVMARLPIAVSRLGDIVDAVEKYGIGEVFDETDLNSVAAVIERMLAPAVNRHFKDNVMKAAEELTWEKESVAYVSAIQALVPANGGEVRSNPVNETTNVGSAPPVGFA